MLGIGANRRGGIDGSSTESFAVEPPPTHTKVVRVGRKRVVVANPYQRQYGHLGSEILFALCYARSIGAPLVFTEARTSVAAALFEVDSPEVRIIRSRAARLLAGAVWRAEAVRNWLEQSAALLRQLRRSEAKHYLQQHPKLPRYVRERVKAASQRVKAASKRSGRRRESWNYNRRRLIVTPIGTALTRSAGERAARLAAEHGIGPSARLVTVHARERGYKVGLELQDKTDSVRDDSVRNARIETHFPAIDFLVDRGYTVVRLGDPTMTRVKRPGVVDLATSPGRDPLLDVHCLLCSRFILCGESGPYGVSFLTNTPLLCVNATDPVGTFPIRADGIYLLKTIVDRESGHTLTCQDLLSEDYLRDVRNVVRFDYIENTGGQILDAVREMLELLERRTPESPGQAWYRELVTVTAQRVRHLAFQRKWGADRGFLGHGRLARSLADPWFEEAVRASTEGAAALT